MYNAEVLSKLPVMQHFLFGSILPYDGPPPLTGDDGNSHAGHAHPHIHSIDGVVPTGKPEAGWGDCCGIPVPSAFAAAKAEMNKPGLRLAGPGIRPVPFD